jgi:hypothetical protein
MLSTPWVNSAALLERMNFSLALAGNRLNKGVTVDWLSQLGPAPMQLEEQERQMENLLLHGQLSQKTRELVLQQLGSVPTAKPVALGQQAADREAALTAGLLFGSPDFQRR